MLHEGKHQSALMSDEPWRPHYRSGRFMDFVVRFSTSNNPLVIGAVLLVWIGAVMALFMVEVALFAPETYTRESYIDQHALAALFTAFPFALLTMIVLRRMARLQQDLAKLAATDMLTGLTNRRAFLERAKAENDRRGGVLMVLDVDHFKKVNDTHGHDVGDQCLRALADLMREETRATDVVGRLGGEEFAIYLVDAPLSKAREIGERFADGVEFSLKNGQGGNDLKITTSVGVVPSTGGMRLEELVTRADELMYEAKRAGRARLLVCERIEAGGDPVGQAPSAA